MAAHLERGCVSLGTGAEFANSHPACAKIGESARSRVESSYPMNRSHRTSRREAIVRRLVALIGLLPWLVSAQSDFQGATHMVPFEEDTISYNKTPSTGPIARLQSRLDRGEVKLKFDPKTGWRDSVLAAMEISPKSQVMVFSKTSLQRERIAPQTPRALYFNDEIYVGWIPGAPVMEFSEVDPKLGGVFYTLDQTATDQPKFVRNNQCLECHASAKTMGVPGHLIRSFKTDEQGIIDLITGVSEVNHRTPLEDRWGGWYVTGTHGKVTHRGNLIGKAAFLQAEEKPNYLGNLTSLKKLVDLTDYATPHSDIVALMVLEHEAHMHNYLTRLHYETTMALSRYQHIRYLRSIAEGFLKYLLFTEETPLKARVKGTSGFAEQFAALGPKDSKGRSFRQFDLESRLFKYPCSFLIYSEAFDLLPKPMREHVLQRLHEILTGKDASPEFANIPAETRQAILEILVETKPNLPAYWRGPQAAAEGAR